jgi:arylsulfatase A-like enzyme
MPIYPSFNEADMSDKAPLLTFYPQPFGADVAASLEAHYRGRIGSLFAVDDLVARVHRALARAGVARNTVIIFTSDNGWILGEHRLYDWVTQDGNASGVKYVPFEGSSRVPLIIAGPGFPEREKVEGVTVNADLAPTILKLAGARGTLPRDGVSLLRAARHPDSLDGRSVLLETATNPRGVPPYKSIRTERYRLDLQADGQTGLYDLRRDPWELQSVHNDPRYARIGDILRAALDRLATCTGQSCHVDVGKLPRPAP